MEERITALCQNFMENQNVIKKVFRLESSLIYPIAANHLSANGVTGDAAKLKECHKIISKNSGAFSYLNGMITTPFAVYLSMKEDPKAAFDKVKRYYDVTKQYFGSSEYSALLALQLSDRVGEDDLESVVARGKELHRLMKEKHPFITGGEDGVLAGFLALSEKSNNAMIDDMEECYELLKDKFFGKDSVQTVSHVLSITNGSVREKTEHMMELYDMLKAAGRPYDVDYLATLAAVSMLDDNNEKLRDTILEIDEFLSQQKGYGFMGMDKKSRLMHAAMLTADLYDSAQTVQTPVTTSAIALVVAQEVAIAIAMMLMMAAAVSTTTD